MYRERYNADRAAAAAAFGPAPGAVADPGMSADFARALVERWLVWGNDAWVENSTATFGTGFGWRIPGHIDTTRTPNSFNGEQLLRAVQRLGEQGAGADDDVGPDGLILRPGALWKLIADVALTADAVAGLPSRTSDVYEILGNTVKDTAAGVGDGAGDALRWLGDRASDAAAAVALPVLVVAGVVAFFVLRKG